MNLDDRDSVYNKMYCYLINILNSKENEQKDQYLQKINIIQNKDMEEKNYYKKLEAILNQNIDEYFYEIAEYCQIL